MRLLVKGLAAAGLVAAMLWLVASAPAQVAGDFVKVEGNRLVFQGRPVKLKGINFYPKDQPWAYMWTRWDGEAAKRDFARARELGINSARILVPYEPSAGWTDKDTGEVEPVYLDQLRQMVQIAGEMDVKLIIALFDFYDPGDDELPRAEAERRNLIYVRTIVGAFANDDRVLAWDLHNEPDQYSSWRDDDKQREFIAWMDMVAKEIRRVDPNHPITVGMSLYDSLFIADDTGPPYPEEPARGLAPADLSDFLSFHSYNAGSIDWQVQYIKLHSDKPIVLQETGWPSGPPCTEPVYTESQQALLYKLMLEGANKHDLAGVLNWQLWDFPPGISLGSGRESHEDYFGLLNRDGTWKPAMALFRDGWPGATATTPASALPSRSRSSLPLTKQPPPEVPTDPNWVPPLYFPETGHYAHGLFRDYWKRFGGLAIFGYPLTEQRKEGEYWVQYFERARFEYHPEYARTIPNWKELDANTRLKLQIQLTRLGADLVAKRTGGKGYPGVDPLTLPTGAYFFPQTGHAIYGRIAEYWQKHNGLTNFGYPLSRVMEEVNQGDGKTYQVQYFERMRLELHPENAGTPYDVLLGLMGKEMLAAKGCR